jgi:tetratricopeptide (TPR) repeat protein
MEFLKKTIILGLLFLLFRPAAFAQVNFLTMQEAFSKSYVLETQGNYKLAADQIKAVYIDNSYEINLRLGWLNYMAGNFNESIAFYKKSMALMPYADEPKFGYIFPLSALGNWDKVIGIYNEILANSPHNTRAMYYLGSIYYNRGQFDKAILNFKQIVDLYPFDYDGLLMYAWSNLQLGNKKDAKILFQKVLLNKPKDASALEGLALTGQ